MKTPPRLQVSRRSRLARSCRPSRSRRVYVNTGRRNALLVSDTLDTKAGITANVYTGHALTSTGEIHESKPRTRDQSHVNVQRTVHRAENRLIHGSRGPFSRKRNDIDGGYHRAPIRDRVGESRRTNNTIRTMTRSSASRSSRLPAQCWSNDSR